MKEIIDKRVQEIAILKDLPGGTVFRACDSPDRVLYLSVFGSDDPLSLPPGHTNAVRLDTGRKVHIGDKNVIVFKNATFNLNEEF